MAKSRRRKSPDSIRCAAVMTRARRLFGGKWLEKDTAVLTQVSSPLSRLKPGPELDMKPRNGGRDAARTLIRRAGGGGTCWLERRCIEALATIVWPYMRDTLKP